MTLRLKPVAVHELIASALAASNVSERNAASVADALLAAELAGQNGHGLRRVEAYAAQARAGKVDGHAVPTISHERSGALAIDAAHGFAYPALDLALEALPAAARANGIAMAGIRRSHHCGVAGVPVARLAEKRMIGLMFANAPAAIAPWGGRKPLFGTNPIAFAAPLADGEPIVIDLSLSKVARGRLMAARQKGEPIPEGWALAPDGSPTRDPVLGMAGTMVPLGGAKGATLAIMVELLCAGLTGANYSADASSFFDADGPPPGTGQLIVAIDPEAFGHGALDRFASLADAIDGTEGARVPGSRRAAIRREYERDGIPVEPDLADAIRRLAG